MELDARLKHQGRGAARVRLVLLCALVLLAAGCSTPAPQAPSLTTPVGTTTGTTATGPTPGGTTPATGPISTTPPSPGPATGVDLTLVADGLAAPTLLVDVPGVGLVAGEQDGRLVRLHDKTVLLDIRDRVGSGGERGLLGFAPHPDDPRVGIASYTDQAGDSVLSRFMQVGDGDGAAFDPAGEEVLLRVDQPYANHNGGHVAFGPDGFLYYGLGDGGSGGDPHGNGQDKDALLGSILRLDVGVSGEARPAAGNPYVDAEGADEVWAKGLRNPWRFSFDRANGDLFIADVGQGAREEIDYVAAGTPGGLNFGWPAYEGNERHALRPAFSEVTPPVHDYPLREQGRCAIIGGHVYRGEREPALDGSYLFGDHCSGEIWSLRFEEGAWTVRLLLDSELNITSFGEDADGEVYVVDRGGAILRIELG